jgi:DNA-binding NarL/FixJ family response regulator
MIYEQHTVSDATYNYFLDETNGDAMRRVLVVNNGSILEEGMASLLASTDGLDVLSSSFESEEALMRALDSVRPQVIVISRESSIDLTRLLRLVGSIPDLRGLQILAVGVDSNMIDVYENQQGYELHNGDFLDFIRGFTVKK